MNVVDRRPHRQAVPGRTGVRGAGWALALPVAAVVALAGATAPAAGTDVSPAPIEPQVAAGAYTPPSQQDFSGLSWTEAFNRLNRKLSREYAFTDWKGIRWSALWREYAPRIARAQAAGDGQAYYLALRSYIHRLHDGHVSIHPELPALAQRLVGGGFGLTVTRLESGAVGVPWVQPGGPAAHAGIRPGARIIAWGGMPVQRALQRTSTVLGPEQPTTIRKRYEQLRFLVRSPVGARRSVTYRNPGRPAGRSVRLTAVDDDFATLGRTDSTSFLASHPWPERMVEPRILAGNVGYVRVYAEIDLPPGFPGDHTPTLTQFRRAISRFIDAEVTGIVVDTRANSGGSDQMVADLMGSFYRRKAFYEYQNYIDPATGRFQIWVADDATGEYRRPNRGIGIIPLERQYTGPVVALVDNGCISSGEGVAMGVQNLPNGEVVGFFGTNGSFGMVGDGVAMPGGIEIGWPFGQSLNHRKVVQIDSRDGVGGVAPDVTVPMTMRNARRSAAGHDVVLHAGLRVLRGMAGH